MPAEGFAELCGELCHCALHTFCLRLCKVSHFICSAAVVLSFRTVSVSEKFRKTTEAASDFVFAVRSKLNRKHAHVGGMTSLAL